MMKISTKGRYALRLMVELANNPTGTYVPLKQIAEQESLSEKYLETIVSTLTKAGFVVGLRGKSGGYKLTSDPSTYTIGSILKLTEGDLAPVTCLACDVNTCPRADHCPTLPIWEGFYSLINEYFEGITLKGLLEETNSKHPTL